MDEHECQLQKHWKKDQAKRAAVTTKDGETESTTVMNAEPPEQQQSHRTGNTNQQPATQDHESPEQLQSHRTANETPEPQQQQHHRTANETPEQQQNCRTANVN